MLRIGKRINAEHYDMIRGALVGQEERMLEWRVEHGLEPLYKFLGKDVPLQPFPRGNEPEELQARAEKAR